MGLDKKSLDRIVQFVKAVKDIPGNEEFIAELRKVLEIQAPVNISSAVIPNADAIEKIERYLGLDYSLDCAVPRIDYSFVTEDDIRNQLEADYREMLRYRYGLRAHKVDFMEFCRYVQLQAEMVLNYYYDNRFDSDDEIKAHVSYISGMKIDNINYFVLLVGFCREHNLDHSLLDSVREIRNMQSHRHIMINDLDINNLITKAQNFTNSNQVWFDWKTKTFNTSAKKEIKERFKQEVGIDMKSYNTYVLVHTHPYNDIIGRLSFIVNRVSELM